MQKKPEYQIYIRSDWPLPFVQPWAVGPTRVAKPPFRWNYILVTNLGDKYAWCYHAHDLLPLGHEIDKHLAKSKNLSIFKRQAKKAELENRRLINKIEVMKLDALSPAQLSALLEQWYKVHNNFTAAFMPIDATDETLEADIRKEISNYSAGGGSISGGKFQISNEDLAALLTPNVSTYVQREHKEFCRIAKHYSRKLNSIAARKAISRHAIKWWWTVMGWGQHKPMTAGNVEKNIQKIKNLPELIRKQRQEERHWKQALVLKKRLWIKLPFKAKRLLEAFEVLAEMHDTRKEIQMRSMTAGFAITDRLLRYANIPLRFRNFLLIEEYIHLAYGKKPTLAELQARTKYYWCEFWANGKMKMLSGSKAQALIAKSGVGKESNSSDGIIKGQPASPGLVRGKARVELNASVINKTIKPGEILVTSQTTPEFAPAMKKAGAIITDEGGITSHAAIVSRELKIPCVIATKIATQILKTGELIEVDAHRGLVKKL